MDEIDELDGLVLRYRETQRRLRPPRQPVRAFGRRKPPAGSRIARRFARHALQLARELQLLRRAEARVGMLLRLQAPEQSRVPITPLRLDIGCAGTAHVRSLVPPKAHPPQILHQAVAMTRFAALD